MLWILTCMHKCNYSFPRLQAYELSTLTGTQVMLLVASETGHVYTFATRKLQPMITSEGGKTLIQTCLNSPDPSMPRQPHSDQRMNPTGFEETELSYPVPEDEMPKVGGLVALLLYISHYIYLSSLLPLIRFWTLLL